MPEYISEVYIKKYVHMISGKDTNSSHFFITLAKTTWLDGKHVVFGKILEGMGIVRQISNVETDEKDWPIKPVLITASGVLPVDTPFDVDKTGVL